MNQERQKEVRPALDAEFELRWLRQLWQLHSQFKDGQDPHKVPRAALRAGMELLGAPAGCVAVLPHKEKQPQLVFATPRDSHWDLPLLTAFLRGQKLPVPSHLALGRLRRRGRMWGVLAVQSSGPELGWQAREAISALAGVASELVERMDEARSREVRARLDAKLMEQLRPKDLFYQILHGLRSLTNYDHSAALLMCAPDARVLEVVAEQVAWKKAKSELVGLQLPLTDVLLGLLRKGVVHGFDRTADGWQGWSDNGALALAELLDYHHGTNGEPVPREVCTLCAPLVSRDGLLGVLKVAALHHGTLGPSEARLVSQFLPQVSVALQISRRTESLEQRILMAHRKHAMADLARGVAHDVNNALGAILPLVQQIQADLATGSVKPETLTWDLRDIEQSVQVCRRIFGGMLSFARGATRNAGQASVRQAVECTRAILKDSLARQGVDLIVGLEPDLPPVHGVQADVDQLLLNLCTNARDAMPRGGQLSVLAHRNLQAVELIVADTGCGILPEHLAKVQEPFFTTKPDGNGLGLAICRSISWQMRGTLNLQSTVGKGTCITLLLPAYPTEA